MNILFVCKYNRFRSKVAEVLFKRFNKNKNINVVSAGIIKVDKPFSPGEKAKNKILKKDYDILMIASSRGVRARLLEKADKIIIVANDVPKIIFDHKNWKDKIELWSVTDEHAANERNINNSVTIIMRKVKDLVKKLEKVK